jgi:uncharacterized protein YqeY
MNAVQALQLRLRADLMTAMRERRDVEKGVLRALLAAIDNAQAVPVADRHDKYVLHAFGDPAVEVPRLELSLDALENLLRREQQDRLVSAEQMAALGQHDRALRLRQEAKIIESYFATRR